MSVFRSNTSCRYNVSGSNDKTVGDADSTNQFWTGTNSSRCASSYGGARAFSRGRPGGHAGAMGFAVFMTLPGLVIMLTLLAFVDQLLLRAGRAGLLPWRNGGRQGQISATGFEQLHASFSPGKQNELKERQSALVLRDDEEDGAPPRRTTVDLDGGVVVVRRSQA